MEFTRLLQIVFPEFTKRFKQHSLWALELFSCYPTPDEIARMHINTLSDIIKIHGDRLEATSLIKSLAKGTIGRISISNELLINSIIEDIKHFQKQIDLIDSHLDILMEDFEFLTSIPGIGNVVGAAILGETGDIHRFQSLLSF
jgi:transposase